ncbi:hypothetical protein AQF52_0174 [Streptomyces venezuelae]|nr:hypothetical protein AQF52_0174 [Streptomyces venezuelae]
MTLLRLRLRRGLPLEVPTEAVDHVTVGLVARWSVRGEEELPAVDRLGRTAVATCSRSSASAQA